MKVFKCLNCGFKFKTPKIVWRVKSFNPGVVLLIDRRALYYPLKVCPKCMSDAIQEEDEEKP
ncbi:MAG: hypothetical protein QXR76_03375 [Candidatus Bathyarchaeia archaeon]